MPILDDEEFRTDHEIDFEQPVIKEDDYANQQQVVYVYGLDKNSVKARVENGIYPHRLNVEFSQQSHAGNSQMVDFYFHPEDLERLGVLLQYEARKYMQLRDEVIADKLKKEQHVQQLRENL